MPDTFNSNSLNELAALLRVRPEIDDYCRFGGNWSADHPQAKPGWAYFHIVTQGRCLIEREGNDALALLQGDILLLPRGQDHIVRSRGRSAPGATQAVEFENAIRRKSIPGVAPDTELVCGRLHIDPAGHGLIESMLPVVLVLRCGKGPDLERYRTLMTAIRDELDGGRQGAMAIATDLASALLVMLLRQYLEDHQLAETGLARLLADRVTSKSMQAMMRDPGRNWTLDELAELAATSRTTLVRAFRKAAGFAPLTFLSELRLGMARQRLQAGREPVAKIAYEVGFQSESALSRAFYRRFGVRPGASRKQKEAATR